MAGGRRKHTRGRVMSSDIGEMVLVKIKDEPIILDKVNNPLPPAVRVPYTDSVQLSSITNNPEHKSANICAGTIIKDELIIENCPLPSQDNLPTVTNESSSSACAVMIAFDDIKEEPITLDDGPLNDPLAPAEPVASTDFLQLSYITNTPEHESAEVLFPGTIIKDELIIENNHDPAILSCPLASQDNLPTVTNESSSTGCGKKPSYICDSCGYRTPYPSRFARHARTHTGEKPYACDLCDFVTAQLTYLRKHKKRHTGENSYTCDHCGYQAANLHSLEVHMRKHTGEKPFACDFCDYRASQQKTLRSHLKTHTGEKPYACDLCDYRAIQLSALKTHKKTHSDEKPFACDSCDFRTRYATALRTHMKLHIEVYFCDTCDFRTGQILSLRKHIKMHTGDKPYSCDVCPFKAECRAYLKIHMRIHTGETPYSCDFCEYRANQLSNLKRHLRRHTGEKPLSVVPVTTKLQSSIL